jgi:Asp/Glu/hydantoin racemase
VGALRSVLDIPVIAAGRSMFLTALMLGRRFGIVTMWENWFPLYERILKDLVLTDRCAGMRAAGVNPDNRNLLGGKEEVLPLLYDAALRLVEEDGADVVCLGSTTMHEANSYLAERLPVPVLNGGPLSYQIAEAMTALDLAHSRRAYPRPMVPKPEMIRAMMRAAAEGEASS